MVEKAKKAPAKCALSKERAAKEKTAQRRSAKAAKTKSARKKNARKKAAKRESTLRRLEEVIEARVADVDNLAVAMGLLGAVEPLTRKPKKRRG
jgi:hypothetical protein